MNYLVLIFLCAGALAQSVGLKVGFSSVDITPELEGPNKMKIHLAGFAPYYPVPKIKNRWATGVHDPIWSRAVAIQNEKETLVMISTDLPGLAWKYINPARRVLAKEFKIPQKNIIITSTHAHSGPDAIGYWSTFLRGHQKDYNHKLVDWMIESGRQALSNLRPTEMKVLTTTHYSCFDSKTNEMKRGEQCRLPLNRTDYKQPDGDKYDKFLIQTDKRDPVVLNTMITIMHFVDPASRETIGTFVNWHNHPDTLGDKNQLVSSDFPHYLRSYVEEELGGTAVYFSGTVGCQIGPGAPIPLWTESREPVYTGEIINGQRIRAFTEGDRFERIRSIGYEIGQEVVTAIRTDTSSYEWQVPLSVASRPLDVAPNNFLHLLGTSHVWKFDVLDSKDRMHRYFPRCHGLYGCVRSDLAFIEIGELSILTAPGEVDPVYLFGRQESTATWKEKKKTFKFTFKELPGVLPHLKGKHVAVLGQAQNYLSYIFPKSDSVGALNFKHPNHYEEFVTVNKHLGDDVGNVWMELLGSNYRYNKRKIYPRKFKNFPERL